MVHDLAARRMHHACCARRRQREPDFFRSMLTARCQDAIHGSSTAERAPR